MKSNVITIDQDEIVVRLSAEHDFLLNSQEVAFGYGVSSEVIRSHKANHADELVEGKHFITVTNSHGGITGVENINARQSGLKRGNDTQTLWTKRGIIRLGFFIRSERAKRFRDAAEDLIVGMSDKPAPNLNAASDPLISRVLLLVDELLGRGVCAEKAAYTASRVFENGIRIKMTTPRAAREYIARPSQYPISAIVDILGNREITWTQLQTECLEKLGMCDRTFDRKLAQAVESGRIVRILGLYSALRQEAVK